MNYYHHGDVLLIPVAKIDGKQMEEKGNYNILALGEITGHAHVIEKQKTILFENADGVMFLQVEQPVLLKHLNIKTFKKLPANEHPHSDIMIQPGNYKVGRVKQYDPWKKELENVRD